MKGKEDNRGKTYTMSADWKSARQMQTECVRRTRGEENTKKNDKPAPMNAGGTSGVRILSSREKYRRLKWDIVGNEESGGRKVSSSHPEYLIPNVTFFPRKEKIMRGGGTLNPCFVMFYGSPHKTLVLMDLGVCKRKPAWCGRLNTKKGKSDRAPTLKPAQGVVEESSN